MRARGRTRPAELSDLFPEIFQALTLTGGEIWFLTFIDLRPLGVILMLVLEHHADGSLPHCRWMPLRCVCSLLRRLRSWSLNQCRCGSRHGSAALFVTRICCSENREAFRDSCRPAGLTALTDGPLGQPISPTPRRSGSPPPWPIVVWGNIQQGPCHSSAAWPHHRRVDDLGRTLGYPWVFRPLAWRRRSLSTTNVVWRSVNSLGYALQSRAVHLDV